MAKDYFDLRIFCTEGDQLPQALLRQRCISFIQAAWGHIVFKCPTEMAGVTGKHNRAGLGINNIRDVITGVTRSGNGL